MNIKKRLKFDQPDEYQKLKEQYTKNKNHQQDNYFILFILWLDKLLDKPIKKLLKLRKRTSLSLRIFW